VTVETREQHVLRRAASRGSPWAPAARRRGRGLPSSVVARQHDDGRVRRGRSCPERLARAPGHPRRASRGPEDERRA
jgi:hypothetical protein